MPILCLVPLAPSLAEGCELVQCAQGRRERFGRRKVSYAGAHAARSSSPHFPCAFMATDAPFTTS